MNSKISRRARYVVLTILLQGTGGIALAQERIVLTQPETVGMSMFRAHWDKPLLLAEGGPVKIKDTVVKDRGGSAEWGGVLSGPLAFDALNRSLLVRFPDAAEKISTALKAGKTVTKVELVLPFHDEELWPVGAADYIGPDGYTYRTNWDVDKIYRAVRPRWHAVAWALRRPWSADAELGPTFNSAVNGKVFWTRFGASDTTKDRFPARFGPAEVSHEAPEGRVDVTAALADTAYGATLAQRLRTLADCGFVIQKEETYDAKYFTSVYEWATATGPRAILVKTPSLVVTLGPGRADLGGNLPPATNIKALAAAPVGKPTAVMPAAEEIPLLAEKYSRQPAWMEDWQWQRTRELLGLKDPAKVDEPFWFQFVPPHVVNRMREGYRNEKGAMAYRPAKPELVYSAWVDQLIGRPVRGWSGFETAREMSQWYNYGTALPEPARDAIKRYWTAWLMPDRDTAPTENERRDFNNISGQLIHPMADDPRVGGKDAKWPDPIGGRFDTYVTKTGDWRGNKSFFRSGFTQTMSTQNFNTTSSAGALLAGTLIGSEKAMKDGRHGMEIMPLRQFCWTGGFGQEHIDHYYFPITIAGNKAIADYSATPFDKLMGQSLITKNVQEAISVYHPGLRSFIAGSSRSALEFRMGMQDGLQHIIHTLSKSGAERDLGVDKMPGGFDRLGHDLMPDQVARQTVMGPWAPNWVLPMVDDKPLPFEITATGWGGLKRAYMGVNYGLASAENHESRFMVMADWRREAKQVVNTGDMATLDMRYSTGKTMWMNTGQGHLSQPGTLSTLQQKNKLIAITSPKGSPDGNSMQSSIGFFTQKEGGPTWEIYVDEKRVTELPFTAKQGQRITIKDGVTYLGVIALPATNLGRDAEVTLELGVPQKGDLNFYRSTIAASLEINSFNYKSDKPLADAELKKNAGKAYGGYVLEMGDVAEFGNFEKFQTHLKAAKVDVAFDAATNIVSVTYASGKDVLEASSRTVKADGGEIGPNLETRLLNGKSTDLPQGMELDSPYSQQGYGKVIKNGATLEGAEKQRVFLLTEPKSGVYCGWNPLPDLNSYNLTLPGGVNISADGKVGLCRITVDQKNNKVLVDHAFKEDQKGHAEAAKNLLLTGFGKAPVVEYNGKNVVNLKAATVAGKTGWSLALTE